MITKTTQTTPQKTPADKSLPKQKTVNSFSQFLANLFRKNEVSLHELKYIFWECTLRCNLNCLHCGSDCCSDAAVPDMPFDDFLKSILPLKEKHKPGDITVAITGGEPLLRKDLPECGAQLKKHGFRWGIVTNGFAYTPELHSSLLKAGMGSLTLSIDGMEESHNWLRSSRQSFEKAMGALELITASDRLSYDVVTCVNQKNLGELPELMELLIAKKVKAWRLFTISPIGRAAGKSELSLNPKQLKDLMDFIVKARSDKRISVTFSCEAYTGKYEGKVRDSYFFCRAGIQIASVLIDGSISACPNINRNFVQGNIYKDNLIDVWENKFDVMRNRSWAKTGICRDCKDFKNCQGGAMHLWDENQKGIKVCLNRSLTCEATGLAASQS